MPRPEPVEDAEFPVYRVRAVCSNDTCGRKGWTKALREYPKGTVISTPCTDCVKSWEARVDVSHRRPLELVKARLRNKAEPERKPLESKPHWTDKL